MKVKILHKNGKKMKFILEDVNIAFANALRRTIISEVPTMAIKWADIHENSSVMFDEMLTHRLGLIPLVSDPEKFNFSQTCKCNGKGCSLCQVTFILDKKGPATVYSGDLISSNKLVKPIDPKFIIAELLEGQNIKLEAIARLGTAKEHARHQAAIASYQYWPELKLDGIKNSAKAIKKCPKGLLAIKGGKIVLTEPTKCDICRACEGDGLSIQSSEKKIIFNIESVSGLDPEYIVTKSADIIAKKAEEFKKEVAKL
jgi:DNA-directed RNA polymerase subunit D